MNAPTAPLRTNLRTIDQDRARLQTALISALNRRLVAGLQTSARVAPERDRRAAIAWIQFRAGEHPVRIAPLLVDGTLAHLSGPEGPDAAAAAATLARIEPLVAALELALGKELQPAGLDTDFSGDPILLRVDGNGGGAIRHRLLVAVPPELDVEPLALPGIAPEAVAGLRLRWTARISGPAISPQVLNTLAPGDLVLLGTGSLVARLSLPNRNDAPRARLALIEGTFIVEDEADQGARDSGPDAVPQSDGNREWEDQPVPIVIEIAGGGMTAAELATLGKGSVIPLPARGGALGVELVAAGDRVAQGELVALGEGYGVLITRVTTDQAGDGED